MKETGVIVEATIKLRFTAYGEIERLMRNGNTKCVQGMAQAMVDDAIECCGYAGEDMTAEEVLCKLAE